MKTLLFFLLTFVFALSLAFFWIFEYGGFKFYLSAVSAINKLPAAERVQTRQYFDGVQDKIFNGTLIKVNTKDSGGVWIWGRKGPRYFKADENSVFSYYQICENKAKAESEAVNNFSPTRTVDTDIKKWQQRVKQGDWTGVILTTDDQDGTVGNLREVISYDSWFFMPKIEFQCEK